MSRAEFDTIVIGVGAMGASTCWQLASRGQRVLGLEQYGIPHDLGSSHGHLRMIRVAYYEHADYVPLLKRAYELWRQLERESGRQVLIACGGLYLGPADGAFVSRSAEAAEHHDLAYERLDTDQLHARYPMFVVPDDYAAMLEPTAGYLRCEDAVSAMAEQALAHGADLHGHEPAASWEVDRRGVTVRTDRATYRARTLVVAAGAWSAEMARDLGVSLPVTRQTAAWLWPKQPELFAPDRFPCWGIEDPDGRGLFYGFPPAEGRPGLRVAHHRPGPTFDPSLPDRTARPQDAEPLLGLARAHLPEAAGSVLSLSVCPYTNSPDGHFLLGRHPDPSLAERVVLAAGFSGHGFKFASVVGEALADLTVEGSTDLPIEFLAPGRFTEE